jgi:hypothetical protein
MAARRSARSCCPSFPVATRVSKMRTCSRARATSGSGMMRPAVLICWDSFSTTCWTASRRIVGGIAVYCFVLCFLYIYRLTRIGEARLDYTRLFGREAAETRRNERPHRRHRRRLKKVVLGVEHIEESTVRLRMVGVQRVDSSRLNHPVVAG